MDILKPILTDEAKLTKIIEVSLEDEYGTVVKETRVYTINCKVFFITLEDTMYSVQGAVKIGDARGYFNQKYYFGTEIIEVRPGDMITYKEVDLTVSTIMNDYNYGNISFRECFLTRKS